MAGSRKTGLKAAETNKKRYGDDFYNILGHAGGVAPYKGLKGFAWMAKHDPERLKAMGSRGGKISKRK